MVVQDSSSPCRTEAPSAAPAAQNEPEVLQVLHLHANGGAPSAALATENNGAPNAAPAAQNEPDVLHATQNEPEVLQVLRIPRKNEAAPKVNNFCGPL